MTKFSIVNAAVGVVTGTAVYAEADVAAKRMAICVACPKMNQMMKVCKACGCYLPGKVKFAKSECPERKW